MNEKAQAGTVAKRLAGAGIGAVVSSLLFSVHMFIPPAGLVLGLLAPFPALFSRLRSGRGAALIISLGATTLLTAGFGFQAGGLYLAQCGVIALLLPEFLLAGFGAARSIAWTTAANLLVYLLAVGLFMYATGSDLPRLHTLAVGEINGSIAQALAIYEQAGVRGDELAAAKQAMTAAASLLLRLFPALTTVMLMVMSGCNLALLKRLSSRFGFSPGIGRFRDFRNPEPMIWLLIAAGFGMLTGVPTVTGPSLNVLVLMGVLYFLQGMAVISSILCRFGSAGILRVALCMLLVVQPYTAALVAALGIFDLWGDFRTPRKQENL
jgi:uncharacterized protein YybS (DUF2232 family)